ncbi:MAG: thiamine phosphate synthase [Proteobacteria bacterium]|nr:thiamine phosphate synthase [Pseudomonadota bacterium]
MTRILAITPGDGRDLRPWIDALDIDAILLREPGAKVADLAAHVAARGLDVHVHSRCADRPEADYLHIRGSEATPGRTFGVSCHSTADLDTAFARGAAYALLSPVFAPTSKPDDRRTPLGRQPFLDGAADRPVYALGGITTATAFAAYGLAVSGFFFEVTAAEARQRSRALRAALQKA